MLTTSVSKYRVSLEVSEPRDLFHFWNIEYPNELMSHEEYFSVKIVEYPSELIRHKAYLSTNVEYTCELNETKGKFQYQTVE